VLSLAKRGVHSIFTYQSNRAEAHRVVALAREAGAQTIPLQLDTGNVRAFDEFVVKVRDALHRLGAERFDYLINNAGTSHHNAIEKTTEAELDSLYNVHFKGVFFLTQNLPLMNDGGRIVNVSSGLTRFAIPGSASYASMKRVADMTALGRVGLPDDIGPMIASLVSADDRWINGQRIEVSGGMVL
jgi:NAD(P)-dependent dehydrogenase (short-subunit alcohol dehydrogenase family)